ncbi:MAG: MetQ/NlpA family ABC transporter substrate-binding protein [Atopobiaceae bacterium]|nr:MetQ/NlpA family ABC transporter substrate-binding protein [Atopobiaceae bacterium]
MLTRRNFVTSTLGLAATATLAACGGSSEPASDGAAESQTLSVAATPEPHAKILTEFAAPKLAEQGIELEVKEFTDYVQPNEVVYNGEIDCNYFQHINYLRDYDEQNGEDLVSVAKIHYEPFGIYAGKSDDLANIADGAVVAVPNDPTNEARALLLLQQEGLITLKNPEDLGATPNDISENPHNIEFREIEAAATPRALEDVDFAAINGNYAIEAGLHATDALVLEEASGIAFEEYANIICTSADKENDERIAALVAVLQTDEFKAYLEENFGEDVLPAF